MSLREYPKYAIAAVGAILILNNNILLIKRSCDPNKGLWSIPGGVIEAGENVYEAAKRELKEETGVDAEPLGVSFIVNTVIKNRDSKIVYHYLILGVLFNENSVKGVLKPGGDAVDVALIPLEEISKRSDITESTKQIVDTLIKARKSSSKIDVLDVYEVIFVNSI